jgi:CBS domain-containing protein
MDHLRRPEKILTYRSLQRILASKPRALWSVGPTDSALTALQIMADKHIGFLVVLEQGALVGLLSERDCARRVLSRHGRSYPRIRRLSETDASARHSPLASSR